MTDLPLPSQTGIRKRLFRATHYALEATLNSGQAFGWNYSQDAWCGAIDNHWVGLRRSSAGLLVQVAHPHVAWARIADYLQTDFDLPAALRTFPADPFLQSAVRHYRGLRVLRQDPWICLASFLLSATKQIVQIRQVYQELCNRFGLPVATPPGHPQLFSFPTPQSLAAAGEAELRSCRMGFRARYLHAAAQRLADGSLDLLHLRRLPLQEARRQLMALPGVGRKIADCVLLFSCDQPRAFPIDVWIARTLRAHYFNDRSIPLPQLQVFAEQHFGPHAGLAQQYLFHYARKPEPLMQPL